eukprot:770979-Amphidinium_carterae.1
MFCGLQVLWHLKTLFYNCVSQYPSITLGFLFGWKQWVLQIKTAYVTVMDLHCFAFTESFDDFRRGTGGSRTRP